MRNADDALKAVGVAIFDTTSTHGWAPAAARANDEN